jgi:hypothetical protein
MMQLYSVISRLKNPKSNDPAPEALRELANYQRDQIRDLEKKQKELALELHQARSLLDITGPGTGQPEGIEPEGIESEHGLVDETANSGEKILLVSGGGTETSRSSPALAYADELEAALDEDDGLEKLKELLRGNIKRLKEMERESEELLVSPIFWKRNLY